MLVGSSGRCRRAIGAFALVSVLSVIPAGAAFADDVVPSDPAVPPGEAPGVCYNPGMTVPADVAAVANIRKASVRGQGVLVVSPRRPPVKPGKGKKKKPAPAAPVKVVYFAHGVATDQWEAVNGAGMQLVTGALVKAGYTVVSGEFGCNGYGNPGVVRNVSAVREWVWKNYRPSEFVVMGQSMGGITMLNSITQRALDGAKGWIGISPVCNLGVALTSPELGWRARFAWKYEAPEVVADHDPMQTTKVTALSGLPMLFTASPGDTVVPIAEHTTACAQRFTAAGAVVSVLPTNGDHADVRTYPAKAILGFVKQVMPGAAPAYVGAKRLG